jgi:hypothetical protein
MHSLTAQNSKIEFAELYQLISNIGIFEVRARPDAANFDFKADPELAAGKYQISLKSKLPHLALILDGHFVAGYRIWE